MDKHLRLLKRQAENDPDLLPKYVRALERAMGSSSEPPEPLYVWVVVLRSGDEVSKDNIYIFALELDAKQHAMRQMLVDIETAIKEGADVDPNALQIMQSAIKSSDYEIARTLYIQLAGAEFEFIVEKKEIRL